MQLNAVVLPAPFGPISPTISYSLTSRLTSCRACSPPKRIDRSATSSTDTGALHMCGAGVGVFVMQGELVARQPSGERAQLPAEAARGEDQGLQKQQGTYQAGQRALVGAVVALEHRDVLELVVHRLSQEELVQQELEDPEEGGRDDNADAVAQPTDRDHHDEEQREVQSGLTLEVLSGELLRAEDVEPAGQP